MHLPIGEDRQVDLVRHPLELPLQLRRQEVRGLHERGHQLRQLRLDHLLPRELHTAQVTCEGVHPADAPLQLLVDPLPRGVHLGTLHDEEEVVGELVEHRLQLLVVDRGQLLEAASHVRRLRLELDLHRRQTLLVRLDCASLANPGLLLALLAIFGPCRAVWITARAPPHCWVTRLVRSPAARPIDSPNMA